MSLQGRYRTKRSSTVFFAAGKIGVVSLIVLASLAILTFKWSSIQPIGYNAKTSHPHDALTWSIPELEHVAMRIIPASSRYDLGAESWKYLLPESGHVVHHTEPDGSVSTHTVAMFHQLRCLEILHDAYIDEGSHRTSPLPQHCMNYLRQTMLCQMDMRTEMQGSSFSYNGFDQMCYDWEVIYKEADRNFQMYSKMLV